jgi:ubiquinone/menaquinone biosynthesis C-methylase UbiE
MRVDGALRRDIIGWDVATWSEALSVWETVVPEDVSGQVALELGANQGGLSVYLALKGYDVICSDLASPEPKAGTLHRRYGISSRVTYAAIDATLIELPDESVDVVAFKSLIAVLAKYDGRRSQQQAMLESWRVLKRGGLLLFAENLCATSLHMALRHRFVRWGAYCHYPNLSEYQAFLAPYDSFHVKTTGFLGTLGRNEWQRSCLHAVDVLLDPLVPRDNHYLAVGWARK